ncbi:mariner Mos1 transposase [Trichonephila clavipes]|nr:mariner Mos1 transposase [Trichonephila clavipes]
MGAEEDCHPKIQDYTTVDNHDHSCGYSRHPDCKFVRQSSDSKTGNTSKQIKDEWNSVYEDSAPSFTTVKFWAAEFKRGCKSLGDDERLRRPNTATTGVNIDTVRQMLLDDRRIKSYFNRLSSKRKKIITGAYCASLLDKLKTELVGKRPHFKKKKILFHQDNAPSHASAVTMAKIHELRFELLDLTPYSPDLAPSNFFFFPHVIIALGGQRLSSNEEAITFVIPYFAKKNSVYYLDGLQTWGHRWDKCVELQGDYVEK